MAGKVKYVQGTGASSIVMAAERWAMRRAQERDYDDNVGPI